MSGIDPGLLQAMQAFDDQALATLANPGLLRRAQRDLAEGKIALEAGEAKSALLAVDGQMVEMAAAGPVAARCDCPAVGVCRHRIAAVLFLRDLDTDGEGPAPQSPPADAQEIVATISLADARKFAGRPGWRAALELLAEVQAVEPGESSIAVRFAGLDDPVLILRGQGMAGIVSNAAKAKKKPYHAAALISARRHFGLPEDGLGEADAPVTATQTSRSPPDPQFLARVEQALGDIAQLGFNLAPESLEESLFALSVSSRADALPRLASILRGIAAQMRLKRARSFEFDAARMLELTATAHALARAVGVTDPDAPQFTQIAGKARREYTPVDTLELVGCGAEIWQTPTGARGITAYFLEEATGRFHSLSLARGAGQDPTFEPLQAFRHQAVWQAGPMETLVRARVRLRSVGLADGGRLSSGKDGRAEMLERGAEPANEAPHVHADWYGLHAALQHGFGLGVDASSQPQVALLSPADTERPYFDELAQRLVWPVRDGQGRRLALTLDHDERTGQAIARLEGQLRGRWRGRVLVRATQEGQRIVLAPVTLYGRGDPVDLTIPPPRSGAKREQDFLGWMRSLRPRASQIPAQQQPSASARAVEAAWKHVLDRLEAGANLAHLLDSKRAAHAARLTDYGMAQLGELVAGADDAKGLLTAAYALLVARQQRIDLPYLA